MIHVSGLEGVLIQFSHPICHGMATFPFRIQKSPTLQNAELLDGEATFSSRPHVYIRRARKRCAVIPMLRGSKTNVNLKFDAVSGKWCLKRWLARAIQ